MKAGPFTIVCSGLLTLSVAGFAGDASAQSGDRKGQKMPEVWREMAVPAAPVVPPAEALATFRVAPGFRLELVASEPLIEDPVAIAWDEHARMWAVEMRGYMPNVDGKGEDARVGRVVVLEDLDGDGRMDRSTPFVEGLQMPRALALMHGGVLVAEPPYLWFCRDTDGDLRCDEKVKVHEGYGSQGPVEHTDNGLLPGLDGWLYNAKSSRRHRLTLGPDGQPSLTMEPTLSRGQWGITRDDFGRLYYNSNSSYLSADGPCPDYAGRNPNHTLRSSSGASVASDQQVHSIRVNPGVNRGYQAGTLRPDGRLKSTTATCGPGVYRGDQFPQALRGDIFIPEPAGNVVAHFRAPNAKQPKAQHVLYEDPQWGQREFLASTDERFRPVQCLTGPDGCLYVVDLYRGILQHRVYVTTFLRTQVLERGLDKPVGLGRVYRVSSLSGAAPRSVKLAGSSDAELVNHLNHGNGWVRDAAQRLLIERRALAQGPLLAKLMGSDAPAATRAHAAWTLLAMDRAGASSASHSPLLSAPAVQPMLSDAEPRLRDLGVRLAEFILARPPTDEFEKDEHAELLWAVLALTGDRDPGVLAQLACTLGTLRGAEAERALRTLLRTGGSSASLRDAALSGLAGRELEFLQRSLSDAAWDRRDSHATEALSALAACVVAERKPARVARLLDLAAEQNRGKAWRGEAILQGALAVAFPKGRAPKPIAYESQPPAFEALLASEHAPTRQLAQRLTAFVTWGKLAEPPPPPRPLTEAEQRLFTLGKDVYAKTCAGCHQDHGLGEEDKAPPLLDSPFALGSDEVLTRIVLHGVTGPVEVHGRSYDMTMPGIKGFTDEQVAAVLTYVRRNWEHAADPVTPESVKAVREKHEGRELPWTIKELTARP